MKTATLPPARSGTRAVIQRQISDAVKPLYDSLDDRQRRRLVQFVHDALRADEMDDSRDRRR
jgi:hypothetical protein